MLSILLSPLFVLPKLCYRNRHLTCEWTSLITRQMVNSIKPNSCDIALCWSPYPFCAKHLKHLELHLSSLSGQETVCGQASRISFRPIRNNITLKLIYSYQPWRVAQGMTSTKITNNTTQISPSFRSVVREYSLCLQYYI